MILFGAIDGETVHSGSSQWNAITAGTTRAVYIKNNAVNPGNASIQLVVRNNESECSRVLADSVRSA